MSGFSLSALLGPSTARKDSEVFQAPADALVFVQGSHTFYRNAYRALVVGSLGLSCLLIFLILFCSVIVFFARPQDRFFTASVDGKVEQLLPLDTPTATPQDVLNRVAASLAKALTFGYLDYEQRRSENGILFTPQAYEDLFQRIITPAGLTRMRSDLLVFNTEVEPSLPAGVVKAGINPYFIYEWVLQIPLRLTTQADAPDSKPKADYWMVQVLVQRATDVDVKGGYIITSLLSAAPVSLPPTPAAGGGKP